jgi:cytidylate kinase
MYRAVAYLASRQGIAPDDAAQLDAFTANIVVAFVDGPDGVQGVIANGLDVTTAIREPDISQLASTVSAHPGVRTHLMRAQRTLGASGNVVIEGRDIGTVVFPTAPVKFFVTARPEERARRRSAELGIRGVSADTEQVEAEQAERDARDSSRAHAPLMQAPDAIVLDTTDMSLQEVIDAMEQAVERARVVRAG